MYKAAFEYNANAHRQSMKMMVTDDPSAANPAYNLSYTRYYVGEYEKQVSANNTIEVCYINTPVGLAAAHVTQNNTSEIFYLHTDHLGSIIGVSNSNQQKIYEVSYDAWGKKRAVEFWFPTNEPQTPPSWLWRGYTGHEHLPEFGLINMNARLYDPLLGRMLSPDNYVTNATYSGDFNRYSYARNNPLKYIDPSGNVPVPVVAMIIGGISFGYIGGVSSNNGQINPIDWNWAGNGAWKTYTGIGIGITVGVGVGYVTGYAGTKLFAATKGGSKAAISTKTAASLTTAVGFGVGYAGGFVIGYTNGLIYSGGNGEYALENAMTYGIWGSVAGSAIGIITGDLLQMQDYQERQKLIEEQEKIRMQQVGYNNKNRKTKTIDNSVTATAHYFNGDGEAVYIGDRTTNALLNSPTFKSNHANIINGKLPSEGSYQISMEKYYFHIGTTSVRWNVYSNGEYNIVSYQLFYNDCFCDPNFVNEFLYNKGYITNSSNSRDSYGPNLEVAGGTPYPYLPRIVNFYFKRP